MPSDAEQLIDQFLTDITYQRLVDAARVRDFLLDLRLALAPAASDV